MARCAFRCVLAALIAIGLSACVVTPSAAPPTYGNAHGGGGA